MSDDTKGFLFWGVFWGVILGGIAQIIAGCGQVKFIPKPDVLYNLKLRGHEYIVFRSDNNFGKAFLHDPDCPCRRAE